MNIPKELKPILDRLIQNDARPILVGGCVRDHFFNIKSKDYDIEVFKLQNINDLETILKEFGDVNLVGKSFGILKLTVKIQEFDFSFPRIENKMGIGHKGFEVNIDGNMSYEEASRRRDFTINSIGYDYKDKSFLDPNRGIEDIKNRLLQIVDKRTFVEDPLRVYRAVQFCARFELEIDKDTFILCKNMTKIDEFNTLSNSRIYAELKKLLLKSKNPSLGLNLLNQLGLTNLTKKEIDNVDQMVKYKVDDNKVNEILMFYFLYDSLKKFIENKKLLKLIEKLQKFDVPKIFNERVKSISNQSELVAIKLDILNNMPKPYIEGCDLIEFGLEPGKEFGIILEKLYRYQLEGKVNNKQEAKMLISTFV